MIIQQTTNQSRPKIKTINVDKMHLLSINQQSFSPDYAMHLRLNPLRQVTNGHNNNNLGLQGKSSKSVLKNRLKVDKQSKGCDWFKKSSKKISISPFNSIKGRQENMHLISNRYDDKHGLSKNYSKHQTSTSMLKTPVKKETNKQKRKDTSEEFAQIPIDQLTPMLKQLKMLKEEKYRLETQLKFYKDTLYKQNIHNPVLQALK